MTSARWQVLLIYAGFTLVATALALSRRWLKPGSPNTGLWQKYPTYILINLAFLLASWLPPAWHALTALLAALGALAGWEITRALSARTSSVNGLGQRAPLMPAHEMFLRSLPVLTAALIVLAGWLDPPAWFGVWPAAFLFFLLIAALSGSPAHYGGRIAGFAASVVYLPICLAAYLWIPRADTTGLATAFLYLAVATNDALAQITGEVFGRTPLVPKVSPAKTVEGAAGGLLFAAAIGLALGRLIGWGYAMGALLGLLIGAAGLAGDLIASAWKRALGLRNFSSLLGAQGGVLDRFDSLIFAAPVFYLILLLWR